MGWMEQKTGKKRGRTREKRGKPQIAQITGIFFGVGFRFLADHVVGRRQPVEGASGGAPEEELARRDTEVFWKLRLEGVRWAQGCSLGVCAKRVKRDALLTMRPNVERRTLNVER
jgi:hypothetical protein